MSTDVLLTQPPRPAWVLDYVRGSTAARKVPVPEIVRIANDLRRAGYNADVFNGDLLDGSSYEKKLLSVAGSTKLIAFFVRCYRLPAACRTARFLANNVIAVQRALTVVLGFLPESFRSDPLAEAFDEVILGANWSEQLKALLAVKVCSKHKPLYPIVELGDFEELIGRSGLTVSVLAPSSICPHNCSFCEYQIFPKSYPDARRAIAPRPIPEVLEEIRTAWKQGARNAVFLEGNFLSYPEWTAEFAESLAKSFPQIRFAVNTRLTDVIREENNSNLYELVKAGLVTLCCGLESANNEILSRACKYATLEEYIFADAILRRYGLNRFYNIILGLPGETRQAISQTRDLIERLDPEGLQVSIATPLPGTPMYEEAKKSGWLKTYDLEQYYYYGSAVMEHNIPANELKALQNTICEQFQRRRGRLNKLREKKSCSA